VKLSDLQFCNTPVFPCQSANKPGRGRLGEAPPATKPYTAQRCSKAPTATRTGGRFREKGGCLGANSGKRWVVDVRQQQDKNVRKEDNAFVRRRRSSRMAHQLVGGAPQKCVEPVRKDRIMYRTRPPQEEERRPRWGGGAEWALTYA